MSGRALWLLAGMVLAAALLAPALQAQERPFEALVVSPDPGERVSQDQLLVAVAFIDPDARLDPSSLTLMLDGRNVTPEATIGNHTLRWRPAQPPQLGPHQVTLTARDREGNELPPLNWSFVVTRAEVADPVDPQEVGAAPALPGWTPSQGSVVFEGYGQSVSGPGAALHRNEDFVPRLWVNASGTITPGWRYSTRIHMSGYESSTRQPVNRYRFDLRSERLTATVGDMNPSLQDIILSGRRVRGLRGDVRTGPVQLSLVTGQSRRTIQAQLDPQDPTQIFRRGTHGQNLFAVRPAVGTGDRFQAGFTVLRVRDDVNSLEEFRTDPHPETGATRSANPAPKDNLVAGLDLTARFLDGQVLVQYENGFSLLANDISGGPLTKIQLDSLLESSGFEPLDLDPADYRRFFIMNASMIPLDPTGLTNMAHQLRSTVRAGNHMISFEWRSIGGSYFTLGYPSLRRDRRGFRLRDSFTLLDNTLSVSAGLERDRDNLNDIKPATTTSNAVFADVSWFPSRDRPGVSAAIRLGGRENDLPSGDAGAIDEANRAYSLGLTYPVDLIEGFRTQLNLNASLVTRDDPANPMNGSRNLFYLGGVQAESNDREREFALHYGVNRSDLTGFEHARTDFHRLMANVRHRLTDRWTGNVDGTLTLARSPEDAGELGLEYNRTELMIGGEWEWTQASFVVFSAGVSSYADERFSGRDTREIITRVRVTRGF